MHIGSETGEVAGHRAEVGLLPVPLRAASSLEGGAKAEQPRERACPNTLSLFFSRCACDAMGSAAMLVSALLCCCLWRRASPRSRSRTHLHNLRNSPRVGHGGGRLVWVVCARRLDLFCRTLRGGGSSEPVPVLSAPVRSSAPPLSGQLRCTPRSTSAGSVSVPRCGRRRRGAVGWRPLCHALVCWPGRRA